MFANSCFVVVFLIGAALASPSAHSQATPTNCAASQQAAVECFVANAVATDLTKPRYGMTLAQFESYGVAVSKILQTHHTYLVLVGISSAVADAMPPTNADGSANQAAQDNAVTQTVAAATRSGLTSAAHRRFFDGSRTLFAGRRQRHERQQRRSGIAHSRYFAAHH